MDRMSDLEFFVSLAVIAAGPAFAVWLLMGIVHRADMLVLRAVCP